jgi:hypothetical protein
MRESPRWFAKQSTVVLAVLVAAACATQMGEGDDELDVIPGTPVGSGGDAAGTPSTGSGGSLDAMMGTGGTLPMGGVMSTGSGGTGKAGAGAGGTGKGGTSAGGKGGSGGANAMGGNGGMITMPGGGKGGATTGSGGKGGTSAMGGAGLGSGGRAGSGGSLGSGGRAGSGGTTTGSGGRSSTGGASAGGSAGSSSGAACPDPRDPDQPGATQGNSGSFMTKAAVCYFVEGSFNAWDCSNLADRMVTVNGKAGACGAALPPKVDGGYYFAFTASATTDYTSFFWYTQ